MSNSYLDKDGLTYYHRQVKASLDAKADTTYVDNAIAGITQISFEVVDALPSEGTNGVIYLIANSGSGLNIYDEYIYVNGSFEMIGTTEVDLSNYLQQDDISDWAKATTKPTYTASEVGALPNTTEIPSKTSDLTNDSGFITDVSGKVDIAQGTDYSGKYLAINDEGNVEPAEGLIFEDDGNGHVTIYSGVGVTTVLSDYTLPVATSTSLGGVMPVDKTSDMTQSVGVDESGRLYTAPKGSTVSVSQTLSSGTEVAKITVDGTQTKLYAPAAVTKTSELTNDSGYVTTDTNTTYSLSISGNVITLTGSDGSTSPITLPVYDGGVS